MDSNYRLTRQVVFKVLLTRKNWSCGLVRILYTKTELVFMSAEPREQPDVSPCTRFLLGCKVSLLGRLIFSGQNCGSYNRAALYKEHVKWPWPLVDAREEDVSSSVIFSPPRTYPFSQGGSSARARSFCLSFCLFRERPLLRSKMRARLGVSAQQRLFVTF